MTSCLDRIIDRRCTDSIKWRHYAADVLPMWVADMDFPSPEPVIRALRERVEHGIFGYGCEPTELREVLVDRLHRLYDWQVSADSIVFLPGVVIGFNLACHALGRPGDAVLVQTPVYPPILHAAATTGLQSRQMELTRGPNGRYSIDMEAFAAAAAAPTRLFILCSPHNPVGRVFRRDELEAMAEICLRHGVTVISDEIHCDLVFSESLHLPIASLDPEVAAHTITLMAPSKTYNIAGLGCSFAVIQNPDLRRTFTEASRGLVGHPDILSYTAATAAYRDGDPWLAAVLRYLQGNRDLLLREAPARLPGIAIGQPEGTYLAWLDCRQAGLPGSACDFFLQQARVALVDGADFGQGGQGFVRLNLGCPRSLLEEALERMSAALSGLP